MAKEFKDYDDKYRHLMGKALEFITQKGGRPAREDINAYAVGWTPEQVGFVYISSYTREMVRWAVYEESTAEEWQKWRVSMKGLATHEKLYVLHWLYVSLSTDWREDVLRIRINNYIGALVRGGQLDLDLKVVR